MTPGITAQEYHDRRQKLASTLPPNSIAIVTASTIKYRSGAVFYEFHQDSNFFYLTGFNEPEACAVIQVGFNPSSDYEFHLFVRPKDAIAEQWDGARSGGQAALDVFNADHTGDISDIAALLKPLIANSNEVYTDLSEVKSSYSKFFGSKASDHDETLTALLKNSRVCALKPLINARRIIKSDAEIANMRKAGQISGRAFTNSMRRSFTKEKDLWNYMSFEFKNGGCETEAYVPVVAGGKNALAIHYVRNDEELKNGDCVLVDAGGEYGGYITDITRTWPINGKFSDAQRDLYEMILKVQRSSVAICRASANISLDGIHSIAEKGLEDGLKSLGFDLSSRGALQELFPHHVGHYIGLDVHDCPGYSRVGNLKEGMCVTMEPGIYVPHDEKWPKAFRGIGIRIEDSICVGASNPIVLTTEAVKEVVDIEALRE